MKLFYYRAPEGIKNFGDELNPWMWEKLIPGVFDGDGSTLFVGIGTLLNDNLPKAGRTVVFGSGVGYGTGLPSVDNTWKIYCLRGPLSAKALGVSPELAVTDPAILLKRLVGDEAPPKRYRFAYMPHWRNAKQSWQYICDQLGFGYIDPCQSVESVLAAIGQTEILITEAMHGAIIADALRIPWIAVRTSPQVLLFKWQDWCSSLGLDHEPKRLLLVWDLPGDAPVIARARNWAKKKAVVTQLAQIARKSRPTLSHKADSERLTTKLEERLEQFKKDVAAGYFSQ